MTEPANPFAPKYPAQQWAEGIANMIRLAEADGHEVEIENRCCGCSESVAAFPEEDR